MGTVLEDWSDRGCRVDNWSLFLCNVMIVQTSGC